MSLCRPHLLFLLILQVRWLEPRQLDTTLHTLHASKREIVWSRRQRNEKVSWNEYFTMSYQKFMTVFQMDQTCAFNRLLKPFREIDSIQYEEHCILQIMMKLMTKRIQHTTELGNFIHWSNIQHFRNAMTPTFEAAIDKRMTKFKGDHLMKQYMKQKQSNELSSIGGATIQKQETSIKSTFMLERRQHRQSWGYQKVL